MFAGLLVMLILLTPTVIVVAVVVATMVHLRRQHELALVLATASKHELPLPVAVDALADCSWGKHRTKLMAMSRLMTEWSDLPEALERIPNMVDDSVYLGAHVGRQVDSGTTLAEFRHPSWQRMRLNLGGLLSYAVTVVLSLFLVVSFVMYYIVPKHKKIFADFGVDLPSVTRMLINVTDALVSSGAVALICLGCILGLALPPLVSATVWNASLRRTLSSWMVLHRGSVLRSLSLFIANNKPLPQAVAYLGDVYPNPRVQRRLYAAQRLIQEGRGVWESLRREGLISGRVENLLTSADAAGNLAWATKEMADASDRAARRRMQRALVVFGTSASLVLGMICLFAACGIYMPLVTLLNELSKG